MPHHVMIDEKRDSRAFSLHLFLGLAYSSRELPMLTRIRDRRETGGRRII
jgi:hypothetical protein